MSFTSIRRASDSRLLETSTFPTIGANRGVRNKSLNTMALLAACSWREADAERFQYQLRRCAKFRREQRCLIDNDVQRDS